MDPIIRSNRMKARLRRKIGKDDYDPYAQFCEHINTAGKTIKKKEQLATDKHSLMKGFTTPEDTKYRQNMHQTNHLYNYTIEGEKYIFY